MAKFCTNCGSELNPGTKFCVNCGQKVEQEQNPQVRHALYMLLILNATGLQLFPTTVLTLRVAAGSADPNAILLPTLACTAFSTLVGAGLGLLCYRLSGRREGRK